MEGAGFSSSISSRSGNNYTLNFEPLTSKPEASESYHYRPGNYFRSIDKEDPLYPAIRNAGIKSLILRNKEPESESYLKITDWEKINPLQFTSTNPVPGENDSYYKIYEFYSWAQNDKSLFRCRPCFVYLVKAFPNNKTLIIDLDSRNLKYSLHGSPVLGLLHYNHYLFYQENKDLLYIFFHHCLLIYDGKTLGKIEQREFSDAFLFVNKNQRGDFIILKKYTIELWDSEMSMKQNVLRLTFDYYFNNAYLLCGDVCYHQAGFYIFSKTIVNDPNWWYHGRYYSSRTLYIYHPDFTLAGLINAPRGFYIRNLTVEEGEEKRVILSVSNSRGEYTWFEIKIQPKIAIE